MWVLDRHTDMQICRHALDTLRHLWAHALLKNTCSVTAGMQLLYGYFVAIIACRKYQYCPLHPIILTVIFSFTFVCTGLYKGFNWLDSNSNKAVTCASHVPQRIEFLAMHISDWSPRSFCI